MNRLVSWLSNHHRLNLTIVFVYFLVVVLPHKRFGTFLNTVVFKNVPIDEYNHLVASTFIGIIVITFIYLVSQSRRARFDKIGWLYMIMSLLFVFLIIKYLFVINIEVVHFPQYALLAMLIYPITGNFTSTLIWATLLGILDEGYQYFYLSPDDTGYYDFNDVVTNVVGGAIGLIILRLSGINERHKTKIWKTSSGVALLVLCAVVAFTFTTGFLSLYPSESSSYTLVEKVPESFWITIEHLHKTYHVVSPTEGILMTIGLWIFYSRIGKHEKIQDRIK